MPSITGTFSNPGEVSQTLRLKPLEKARIQLTGPFVGRVTLEKRLGNGHAWAKVRQFDEPIDTSELNYSATDLYLRLRAKTLISGSISYTLEDVLGDLLYELTRQDSTPLLAIKDDGTLEIMGEEFVGGGGGGSPVTLTTLGDLISHDGSAYVRVPMGANGTFLAADNLLGVKWATPNYPNSFTIFQVDAGTNPVATGPTDPITLTSSDGSILITGNSTTDTIDFTVAAAGGVSGPVSSTDRGIATWNGTGGTALRDNSAYINSSGDFGLGKPFGRYYFDGPSSPEYWIETTSGYIHFVIQSGIGFRSYSFAANQFEIAGYTQVIGTFGAAGTAVIRANDNNQFNDPVSLTVRAGNGASTRSGGDLSLLPGESASGTHGTVVMGLPGSTIRTLSGGYPYMPAGSGVPTATPTAKTGYAPYYYDLVSDSFYVFNGTWKTSSASGVLAAANDFAVAMAIALG